MQADAGTDAAERPTKRTRRPSVRLHEPYYENPLGGHRKPFQRRSDGAKKPSIAKTVRAKNGNKDDDDATGAGQGEDIKFDDVAIGEWKNFNVSNRNRDFDRKRSRPSGSKKSSSGKQDEDEEKEEEEDGINSNLVVEDSDPSSPPNQSFSSDDGNDKLSDSNNDNKNNNVDMNQQRGLKNRKRRGVRAWLNELGLYKYAPLFEIHEVDDEVLGQLTLEDLKDMGINAVGSRRKMYASIKNLDAGNSYQWKENIWHLGSWQQKRTTRIVQETTIVIDGCCGAARCLHARQVAQVLHAIKN